VARLGDRLRPLLGSLVLHAALAGALVVAALFRFAPDAPVVHTLQAYVVRSPTPDAAPPARPAPVAPVPEPEPAAPAPTPDPAEAERARADAARVKRERQEAEQERAQVAAREQAEREAAATQAAEAKRRAAEQARAAEAAAAERRAAAAAEEKRRQDAEAKARADAEARRRAEAERADRTAREADLDRRLAEEARRASAQSSGAMDRYLAQIVAQVERNWKRPPTAKPGLRCTVYVTQVPGGVVTDARVGECNGDDAVRQSIVQAVLNASPLPAPPDPSLFDRRVTMIFSPAD
jgi:colicin import membrane protein